MQERDRKDKGKKMEDNRKEQMEALEILTDFNGRLVKNMTIIVKELSGERLDDTDKFLKSIVDAINWEIQVVNGTIELLNDGKERINKEEFNRAIVSLNDEKNTFFPVAFFYEQRNGACVAKIRNSLRYILLST